MNTRLSYSYDIYIAAPAAAVWKGMVDGDMTQHYVYGTRIETTLKKNTPYGYKAGDFNVVDGAILDVVPEKRLVMTWNAHWDDSVSKDAASRVTYELAEARPGITRLRVTHDDFERETATYKGSVEGWPLMLSSLKSLLETGKAIPTN
jgi:uncharacterized protein YndB with AHSA1/START domain